MATAPENPVVTYDVKELIDDLGAKVDSGFYNISTKLDAKADKSEIMAIQKDLDHHDGRITRLEESEATRKAADQAHSSRDRSAEAVSQRRWNWFFSACLVLVGVGGILAAVIH